MKTKRIKDLIPKKEIEYPLQVKLPKSFYDTVNRYRIKNKATWKALVVACFSRYIEEFEGDKR